MGHLNGEIKRRTNVVGIFLRVQRRLDPSAITAVVVETHDEWQVTERRYLPEDSMAKLLTPAEPTYTRLRDSIAVAMSGNNPSEPLRPFLSGRG